MRYLVVGTAPPLSVLTETLRHHGLLVTRAESLEDADAFLDMLPFDLIVADAGLLGDRRTSSAADLRRLGQTGTPVVVLGDPDDPAPPGAWVTAGAETLVFAGDAPAETVARLGAVARRAHGIATPTLRLGPLTLDLHARRAMVEGEALDLTPKVYEILEFLALRPGRLIARETLLIHIYGLEDEPESRVFDVYVHTLRARLRARSRRIEIVTERGSGIRFIVRGPQTQNA